MFKRQINKRKNKSNLIESKFVDETSNFKSGSIELTTEQIFTLKFDKLNELTGMPVAGQQFRIVTQKAVNSFDFILAVLHEEKIEEMIVAFYRIGKKVIQEIYELQKNNYIDQCHFLVNDAVPKLTPDAWNLLKSFENKKWKVRVENNHTKIILLKTTKNFYVIEGSGNLSINARIEQYVFDNNEILFNFHKNWITKL